MVRFSVFSTNWSYDWDTPDILYIKKNYPHPACHYPQLSTVECNRYINYQESFVWEGNKYHFGYGFIVSTPNKKRFLINFIVYFHG